MYKIYLLASIILGALSTTSCFGVKQKKDICEMRQQVCSMKLKNDRYRRARGGNSAIYEINCASCQNTIMYYQKDGPGRLLRCYLNRIMYPKELADLQFNIEQKREMPNLECTKCQKPIGIPMVYSDRRLAFRMLRGNFSFEEIRDKKTS